LVLLISPKINIFCNSWWIQFWCRIISFEAISLFEVKLIRCKGHRHAFHYCGILMWCFLGRVHENLKNLKS
jgi:hypothetical protein